MTMTEPTADRAPGDFVRILVLLDASRPSLAALEAALELAARRQDELHAVFVEETDLLRCAGLTFTREVGATTGAARPLDTATLRTRLRRHAERTWRTLAQAAAARGVRHRLSVRRGTVLSEALNLTGPDDLIILGRIGWSAAPGRRLGSTARALVREAPGRVLLWTPRPADEGPLLVLVDTFESSGDTLAVAASHARQHTRELILLLIPLEDEDAVRARDRAVENWLAGLDYPAEVRRLNSATPRALAHALRQERGAELVLSRRSRLLQGRDGEAFLEALSVPVTITR